MKTTDLTPLEKARNALAAKEALASRHRKETQDADREASELRTVVHWLEQLEGGKPQKTGGKLTKEAIAANWAVNFVTETGPSTISEMYEGYLETGHKLAGKDAAAQRVTLSGFLNRDGRLKFNRDFGRWWHNGQAFPTKKKG